MNFLSNLNWIGTLVVAFLINSAFLGLMLLTQKFSKLPARGSLIPGTKQPFLYWQDFYCQKSGNSFGMPLMLATFLSLYGHGYVAGWCFAFFSAGLGITLIFAAACMSPKHKPDWGYPALGKINLGGILHLLYFWLYMSIILIVVVTMIIFWRSPSHLMVQHLLMFCIGLIIYAITWREDVKSGNFDPLKKLS